MVEIIARQTEFEEKKKACPGCVKKDIQIKLLKKKIKELEEIVQND